jgi:hypothetical protein
MEIHDKAMEYQEETNTEIEVCDCHVQVDSEECCCHDCQCKSDRYVDEIDIDQYIKSLNDWD